MATLRILLLIPLIQVVRLQLDPAKENPVIQFCFSSLGSSADYCSFKVISNSTFGFDDVPKNTLKIILASPTNDRYLLLKCSAPFPIRWLAHKPLGDIKYIDTSTNYEEPFLYVQQLSVTLTSEFSRILRCEETEAKNPNLAAEIYLSSEPTAASTVSLQLDPKYFRVERNPSTLTKPEYFSIPCVGYGFYGETAVRINVSYDKPNASCVNTPKSLEAVDGSKSSSEAHSVRGTWSKNFEQRKGIVAGLEPDIGTAYICRVTKPGGETVPGEYYISNEQCYFISADRQNQTVIREYLVTEPSVLYAWTSKKNGEIHTGTVEGGRTESGETVYICRAACHSTDETTIVPGGLVPTQGACSVSCNGLKNISKYDVLIDAAMSCSSHCLSAVVLIRRTHDQENVIAKYRTTGGTWASSFDNATAVVAGHEHGTSGFLLPAYICRVRIQTGEIIPGKYYPPIYGPNGLVITSGCYAGQNNSELLHQQFGTYEVMVSNPSAIYAWVDRTGGEIANGAIEAGLSHSGEVSFICRAIFKHPQTKVVQLLPGHLVPSEGFCAIPYAGVNKLEAYQVLVDARCSCNDDAEIYDPRIGVRYSGYPNLQSVYTCSSQSVRKSIQNFLPLSTGRKIDANLYYGERRKLSQSLGIHCDPEVAVKSLNLSIGYCSSVTDCDLKYRPMPPSVDFVDALKQDGADLFLNFDQSRGVAPKYKHGYLQCSAFFPSFNATEVPSFVDQTDYFFTGFDNRIYLISDPIPPASVISIRSSQQEMTFNASNTFECHISTFVLLPMAQFVINYTDVGRLSKKSDLLESTYFNLNIGQTSDPNIILLDGTRDDVKATRSWRLFITLTEDMSAISCRSQRIGTFGWVTAEVRIKVERPASPESGYAITQVGIAGSIAAAVVVVLMVLLAVLWRKYRVSKAVIRNLTDGELQEFYHGDKTQNTAESGTVTVEGSAFNTYKIIASNDLKTEEEVLGKGEFGIVRKGMYANRSVAVKTCKTDADIEYFKAFLKEIKVMAYIGEHENVVGFYGAVVDRIQERLCFAVIEFSSFGNLHSFLLKHSKDYPGEGPGTRSVESIGGNPVGQNSDTKLNESVLLDFCKQIASGMGFLAQRQVIHGDLATRNVLVFENNVVKLTDFGLSRKLYNCANYTKTKQAPLPWRWMALESLRYFKFSTQSDVWSFGVTVWEIFAFSQVPFAGVNWTPEFADQIQSGLRLSKPLHASEIIYTWIKKCWENDPMDRPSFLECKEFFLRCQDEQTSC